MDYYKKYGLSDADIMEIKMSISNDDLLEAEVYFLRIGELFDYLASIGITDFKEIFLNVPDILGYKSEEIRKSIEESKIPNLIELLKEDVSNFSLIGF